MDVDIVGSIHAQAFRPASPFGAPHPLHLAERVHLDQEGTVGFRFEAPRGYRGWRC